MVGNQWWNGAYGCDGVIGWKGRLKRLEKKKKKRKKKFKNGNTFHDDGETDGWEVKWK